MDGAGGVCQLNCHVAVGVLSSGQWEIGRAVLQCVRIEWKQKLRLIDTFHRVSSPLYSTFRTTFPNLGKWPHAEDYDQLSLGSNDDNFQPESFF